MSVLNMVLFWCNYKILSGYSSRAPIIQKIFFQSKICGHYLRAAPIQERPLLVRVRYVKMAFSSITDEYRQNFDRVSQ